jgi:hypothetical protein
MADDEENDEHNLKAEVPDLDNLNSYHQIFWNEIRKLSCNKDGKAREILDEWKFSYLKVVQDDESSHCLCTHIIKYIYYYENKLNKNEIEVGSKCIDYWDLDAALCNCGKKLSKKRVENNKLFCKKCETAKIKQDQEEEKQKRLEIFRLEQKERNERIEKARQKVREEENVKTELKRLDDFRVFWHGPGKNKTFKEVKDSVNFFEWATALVNVPDDNKNKSLQTFEYYCKLLGVIEDTE